MDRRVLIQIATASAVGPTAAPAQARLYAPRFFTASEWAAVEGLALALLPEEPNSPGAKSAEVPRYLDTVLLHADQATQAEWRSGLTLLTAANLPAAARAELSPVAPVEKFFVTFKRLALEAFFQSPAGAKFFNYLGNTLVSRFPGCETGNNRKPHPY